MRAWYVVVRIVVMLSTLYTTAGARNQCVANENLLRTIAPTDWAHHEAIHFAPLSLSSEEAMVLKFTNPTLEPVEQSVHLDCQLPDSTAFLPLHPPEEDVSALPFHLAFTVQSMNQEPIPLKGNLVFTAKDNKQFQVSIDTGTPGSDCFTAQIPILMSSVLESLHLTFLPRPEWEVQLSLGLFLDSKIPIKPSVTHTNLLAPLQQADVSSTKLLSQSRALLEAFQWKVNSQIVHQIDWISARSDQNEKASYFLVGPGSFSPKDEYCEILIFETVLKTIPGLHLSNFEFSGTLRTDTTSILEQFLRVCVTVFEQTSNDRKKRASHQICQILSKSMLLSDSPHTLSNKAGAIISFPVHLQIPIITTQTRNPDLPQNNIYLHLSVHMMNADARTSISPRVVRVHYTLDPHWIPPLVDTSGVVRDVHFGVDDNGSRSGNSQRSGGSSFPGWSLVLTVLYAFSFLGSVALLLLLLRLHRTMNLPKSALNRSSLMLTEFIFDAETEDPLYRYGLETDGTSFGGALVQGGEEPSQDGLFCDLNFLNQSSSMQRIG